MEITFFQVFAGRNAMFYGRMYLMDSVQLLNELKEAVVLSQWPNYRSHTPDRLKSLACQAWNHCCAALTGETHHEK